MNRTLMTNQKGKRILQRLGRMKPEKCIWWLNRVMCINWASHKKEGSGCKLSDDFAGHRDARSANSRPRTAISL